jgi:MraZ protein
MVEGGFFEPTGALVRKVDPQGRVALSSRIATELGPTGVVAPGMSGCIELFRVDAWRRYEAHFLAQDTRDPDVAALYRHLIAPAEPVTLDTQGRLRLPEMLLRFAGLDVIGSEVQVIKMPESWEIWEVGRFLKMTEERRPSLEALYRSIFGRQQTPAAPVPAAS